MQTPFSWTCPFCNRHTTITEQKYEEFMRYFDRGNVNGQVILCMEVIVCPNKECNQLSLTSRLHQAEYYSNSHGSGFEPTNLIHEWKLLPNSRSRVFPPYIPQQLRSDYEEACSVLHLSPKASATLSRRCLQGMIRDFWEVKIDKQPTLWKEIEAIKDKVEPLVLQAIDAVRTVGNIGAHMEQDVNLIIDVDPAEAEKLIILIEFLFDKWYIHRYETEKRLKDIISMAEAKESAKKVNIEQL